jgi:hypothetical protein
MKVKITKCSSPNNWYRNNIGDVFDVYSGHKNPSTYQVKGSNLAILIYDCEIIEACLTRGEINQAISFNIDRINELRKENVELSRQAMLLCDKEQWFTESVESHPKKPYQRQPNRLDGRLIGRIHWIQNFKDGSTGQLIPIERSQIVRIDGIWL